MHCQIIVPLYCRFCAFYAFKVYANDLTFPLVRQTDLLKIRYFKTDPNYIQGHIFIRYLEFVRSLKGSEIYVC